MVNSLTSCAWLIFAVFNLLNFIQQVTDTNNTTLKITK